ncbi:MAG: sigma-70 family RNA polymerase sigma factor [Myxococcales bacterium]|nr:sigma-70 family RNA polymerase sigma factor [Myxococcales bacterium]MCB9713086.1 sigma-70 family RNA polymerase sigma factor [Myxococcales bacterium]
MSLRGTLTTARLHRLARRAAAGDAGAFRGLYRQLHPVVWRYVSRRIAERADVEDLVARVFERMVEHWSRFDPARGNVQAWVIGIARNAVIDHLRARRAVGDGEAIERLADAALDPAKALEDDERDAALRTVLAGYPPEVREMFSLRFADGLRLREIAELMDLSEAAVKQRFSRTLRELRAKLRARDPDKAAGYAI